MSLWLAIRPIVRSLGLVSGSPRAISPKDAKDDPSANRARPAIPVGLLLGILLTALAATGTAFAANEPTPTNALYDVSFPECAGGYAPPSGALIIGVNGGRAYTVNRCFDRQVQWALDRGARPDLYMNLNYPKGPPPASATNGPRGRCAATDQGCLAYNYGYNAASYADQVASARISDPRAWWLDVETANYWSPNQAANAQVIQGAIDYWHQRGKPIGIYSILPMWQRIAGGFAPGLPNWVAQVTASIPTLSYCSAEFAFGGGAVAMVQHWDGAHDVDYFCAGTPPAGSTTPAPAANRASGTLIGSTGGSSAYDTFDYWGGNQNETVTVNFSPQGPDTTNGFFVSLWQHGAQLAKIRASDFRTPGQISMSFSSGTSGPMTVQLTSYDDPRSTPPITYSITRQSS
ncbi:MAG: hypothetical protein ACRDIY_09475 [Chloroflexota bacterium]